MNKSPAFQFYPGDWFDYKVLRMGYFSQGVYWRMLCHMWKDSKDQCSISSDPRELMKILSLNPKRFKVVISEIQWKSDPMLLEKNGRYISKRLQKVKRQQVKRKKQATNAGKKGAEKRWGGYSDPNGDPTSSPMANDSGDPTRLPLADHSPSSSTPTSPSSSPSGGGGDPPRGRKGEGPGSSSIAEQRHRLIMRAEAERQEKLGNHEEADRIRKEFGWGK